MKFNEAMKLLEQGKKVTRQSWVGSIYFVMDGSDVKSYQPKLQPYAYNEDIMVSDGWVVEGLEGEHKFYDIISQLQDGKKCHPKEWKEDCFIYFDQTLQGLALRTMEMFPFSVEFSSFMAQDWVELT
jgi:hypothetical protein